VAELKIDIDTDSVYHSIRNKSKISLKCKWAKIEAVKLPG